MKPSEEAHRLHPLTLVQRLIVSLPGLVFILLPLLRNSDSTAWFNLVLAGMYAVFIIPWIVVYYLRFRYWVTPTELIIHSGVITKRKRNIPIERIQNIEIEQAPMQRMLRTAKVAVYTAGSARAEGVLEYVSIDEAKAIRAGVRQMQQDIQEAAGAEAAETDTPEESKPKLKSLFQMDPKRVFQAGAFHFSLLYIAGFFSLLQYIEPDPEVYLFWLLRGPLEPWKATIEASPWTAALVGIVIAVVLGWASGVLLTVNKYFRFRVTLGDGKLYRKHGLLTLTEGTIPLKRIQSLILRSNPLMNYFGYFKLELQTMGIDLKDSGFQTAAPFAKRDEITQILSAIDGMTLPAVWHEVSPLTMRRFAFRYSLLLLASLAALHYMIPEAFPAAWWGLLGIPVIAVISYFRFKNMGYALEDNGLALKKGILRKHIWLIPMDKAQTFYLSANFFQRRLGLQNLYVDTAGASPMVPAELVDLPSHAAHQVIERLYARFKQ
jgi:putative membrane protein